MNKLISQVSDFEPAFYALEGGLFFCPVAVATGQSPLMHFVCAFNDYKRNERGCRPWRSL